MIHFNGSDFNPRSGCERLAGDPQVGLDVG